MGNVESRAVDSNNPPSSVLLAEIASLNQADCSEQEILPAGTLEESLENCENFSQQRFRRCKKHTREDHEKLFIPVHKFGMEHLPPHVKIPGTLRWIKKYANRTVRLIVRHTDEIRPPQFHCGGAVGSPRKRFGTGFALTTDKQTNYDLTEFANGTTFFIQTAAHVVYNDEEAEKTTVEFFFDDDSDRSGVVRARGVKVLTFDLPSDFCEFLCQVENEQVGLQVKKRLEQMPHVPGVSHSHAGLYRPTFSSFVFCVSHPHGTAKRVSIGNIKSVTEAKMDHISHRLKMLVYRCCCELNMDEKKVFYFFYTEVDPCRSELQSNPRYEKSRLAYLEKKGLICKPNDRERAVMQEEFLKLEMTVWTKMEEVYTEKYGTQTVSPKANARRMGEIRFDILENLASKLRVPDWFPDMCRKVQKERYFHYIRKSVGQTSNSNLLDNQSPVASVTYSVPTCPGSSGANVSGFSMGREGFRGFNVNHSKGNKENGNRSGRGDSCNFCLLS